MLKETPEKAYLVIPANRAAIPDEALELAGGNSPWDPADGQRTEEETMSETAAFNRRDLEAKIVARAWADEGFRARLKADPRTAVAEETGVTVPGSVALEVLEETPDRAYLVIPSNRMAVSDEDLDVAGGGEYTGSLEASRVDAHARAWRIGEDKREGTMSEAAVSRRDLEAKIVARAWADEAFRERLKTDPRAAVAKETGITVPESVALEVLEETPDKAYLVIPSNRMAVADEDLDAAGGSGPPDPVHGTPPPLRLSPLRALRSRSSPLVPPALLSPPPPLPPRHHPTSTRCRVGVAGTPPHPRVVRA